jgi:hypothetical protein
MYGVSEQTGVLRPSGQLHTLGLSHYTTHTMGHRSNYSSQLYKTTYHDGVDWQVWHFIGDLPLSERTATGDVLLSTEWLEIS